LAGPLVSIIVATHNQAEYLPQCLESLFDQTMPRSSYEIVLVNDGDVSVKTGDVKLETGDVVVSPTQIVNLNDIFQLHV
ncbi:MAG: glycosyltransferase, partial [Candidatus Heimdallarchaeota archaeon]|nr:glycosyltransferase [Candidatus Heimdallarchaeota archaeon]